MPAGTAPAVVNLAEKFAGFSDHWNPRIVGHCNGNEVRIAKVDGEFTWHSHADSDELFLVISGDFAIEFRDGLKRIAPGEDRTCRFYGWLDVGCNRTRSQRCC